MAQEHHRISVSRASTRRTHAKSLRMVAPQEHHGRVNWIMLNRAGWSLAEMFRALLLWAEKLVPWKMHWFVSIIGLRKLNCSLMRFNSLALVEYARCMRNAGKTFQRIRLISASHEALGTRVWRQRADDRPVLMLSESHPSYAMTVYEDWSLKWLCIEGVAEADLIVYAWKLIGRKRCLRVM